MIRLDHLVIPAPSLEEGVAHVRAALGVTMPVGGTHPSMGTHNHVLRLGADTYLEVIAVDPGAPPREGARWFGLHDAVATRRHWDEGRRLAFWVASSTALDETLAGREALFGVATWHSRGDATWRFGLRPDGLPAMEGALPYLIERPDGTDRVSAMPDLGCRLVGLRVEHPQADTVRKVLAEVGFEGLVSVVPASSVRLSAMIETPEGVREIR